MMLLSGDASSTQRDLIRQTGSDKAGMTRTVEDLENLGYLARTPSVTDRRVAHLTLTELGETTFDRAKRLAGAAADELFGDFTLAELETLESLLTRFTQGREPIEGRARH
jgi:DNA-binding MarR family transcriptional regulator